MENRKTDRIGEKTSKKGTYAGSAAKSAAYIALCVALLSVCAWITIPLPPPFVQFTMQTFAVFFAVILLGERRSTLALIAYVLLGLIGVPVFSGFKAAPALFGPTGGYIVGFFFIPACVFIFKMIFGGGDGKLFATIVGCVVGLLVCYAFGTAWFMVLYTRSNGSLTLFAALSMCVFPYVLPDGLKLALAIFLARRVKKLIRFY